MAQGDFVWVDLSTVRLRNTMAFYAGLFGWTYQCLLQPDGSDYEVASTSVGEVAGVFEMPRKFQEMGLPSFWMPYFAVNDVEATCALAASHGGRVELKSVWSETERIALIRDPLGAGFTVYEGGGFSSADVTQRHGHRTGCVLYISDVDAVRAFYEALFGWRIAADETQPGEFDIRDRQGSRIVSIRERDEDWRDGYQFWGIHFAVTDGAKAIVTIGETGGEILEQDRSSGVATILAKDPDGAAFFLEALSG